MPRVKSQVPAKVKHKKIYKRTKGFYGRAKNTIRIAHQAADRAGVNAYIGRKLKKRDYRGLWIARINAAVRQEGLTYSKFMNLVHQKNIPLDRKMLALLAYDNPEGFKSLLQKLTA